VPPLPSSRTWYERVGDMDVQLDRLMEELANVSQQLANARMSKAEVEEENKNLLRQKDELHTIIHQKDDELKRVKESVVFTKVDSTEQELKKAKAENKELTKKLTAGQKNIEKLSKGLKKAADDIGMFVCI
jgi:chromosome segregation ATPase